MVALQAILEALLFTSKQRLHGVSFQFVSRPSLVWHARPQLYSYFKKRCRKKSKKSSSQDLKVMWVVPNPSFAGKQSLH